jgi:glutathione S-transferase
VKLHYANMSSSSRRASLVVAHLGILLEHHTVDLAKDRTALTKLNPNGKIPVLEDGDLVLWESHAIMQYLCDRTPGQTLYPEEASARADVHRWLYWTSAHLSPAVGPICFERLWKKFRGGGDPDPAVIARYTRFLEQFMTVLDDHLAKRTWVSGNALTLADLSIAATLMYEQRAQLPLEPYRNVRVLLDRVHDLPAWRKTEPAW